MKKVLFIATVILLFLFTFGCKQIVKQEDKPQLSPVEWLQMYNEAWKICDKQVPSVQYVATNPFYPDADIAENVRLLTERSKKVENLVATNFPELCEYLEVPAYYSLLLQQGQATYQMIMQQNQAEINQLDLELNQQVEQNARELELEKDRLNRMLENYSAPEYQ